MKLSSFFGTNPGHKKSENEDSIFVDDKIGLYIVADGMGGAIKGTLASQKTCELVSKKIIEKLEFLEPLIKSHEPAKKDLLKDTFDELINEASTEIRSLIKTDPSLKGMASTLTLLWIHHNKAYLAHVGDSRCYLKRADQLHQLTLDHTYGQLAQSKGITKEVPKAQALTQAIGFSKRVLIDHLLIELDSSDKFILCSDGVSDNLPEDKLATSLDKELKQSNVDELINLALESNARDNITAIAISIELKKDSHITSEDKTRFLKNLPFFEKLNYKEITKTIEASKQSTIESGEYIIHEGDMGRSFFIILKGSAEIKKGEASLSILKAGDYFGEMSVIDGQKRSADVIALEKTSVVEITHQQFFKLIQNNPQLGAKILWNFNKRFSMIIRNLNQKINCQEEDTEEFNFLDI